MNEEVQRTIIVKHERWAAWLVSCIKKRMSRTGLEASIRVVKDGEEHKLGSTSKLSLIRILMIDARVGDELEVFAGGPDAEKALEVFETIAHECAAAGFRGSSKLPGVKD